VKGSKRFLDRVWNLMDRVEAGDEVSAKNEVTVNKTIKKVESDIDSLKMNTAIAALMTMVNEFYDKGLSKGDFEVLLKLLSPFAPHITEEMWELQGFAAKYGKMAMQMPWPEYDESKTVDAVREIAVQINGKLRSSVTVSADADDEAMKAAACADDKIKRYLEGMEIVKTIVVKGRLVNLILKPQK
jgi:leucyl-tRNA synthetase